jgi:hypothetical protein
MRVNRIVKRNVYIIVDFQKFLALLCSVDMQGLRDWVDVIHEALHSVKVVLPLVDHIIKVFSLL